MQYLDEYHFAKITFPSDYKKGQKIDTIAKAPITLTHTTTGRDRVHALELMCNNTILLVLIGFMSWQIVRLFGYCVARDKTTPFHSFGTATSYNKPTSK